MCDYPYVGVNCSETFADATISHYVSWKYIFFFSGIFGTLINSSQLLRFFRSKGSFVQKTIFALLLLGSITVLVRGIDPFGYGDIIKRLMDDLCSSICAACLISVSLTVIMFWMALVENTSRDFVYPFWIKCFGITFHFLIWINLVVLTIIGSQFSNIWYYHFYTIRLSIVILIVWITSIYALFYGTKLNAKVEEIQRLERLEKYLNNLHLEENFGCQEHSLSFSHHPMDFTIENKSFLHCFKALYKSRIIRILFIIQLFCILTTIILVYRLITLLTHNYHGDYPYWNNDCVSCEEKSFTFPFISTLEIIGIFLSYWSFHS